MFRKSIQTVPCPAPVKTLQKVDLATAGRADRLKLWTTEE
ncbi:hypothetical protein OOU_Y34scaffold01176g3 [Pyricularia oryzae Y34]|uniref:Uncharacterized protein n=1 Tax=Pyricularia oryzae (strain Y34) TaxID=1143189 RepID=A0AA97NLK3_PYRO3|nr:hypothetical protein OOU_Y34scaffold01176g3 [Pyricularia oryzae Y34]